MTSRASVSQTNRIATSLFDREAEVEEELSSGDEGTASDIDEYEDGLMSFYHPLDETSNGSKGTKISN